MPDFAHATFDAETDMCPNGHPYTSDNVYMDTNGWRRCRICLRATARRFLVTNAALRERRVKYNKAWRAAKKGQQP